MADEKRYFTVAEANALVPGARGPLRQGHAAARRSCAPPTTRSSAVGEPPTAETLERRDGSDELRRLRGRFRALLEALTEELASVEGLGVAVKDLDIGLCDFLGEREGRDVWLCWQYGEKSVAFWHEINEGFGGTPPARRRAGVDAAAALMAADVARAWSAPSASGSRRAGSIRRTPTWRRRPSA